MLTTDNTNGFTEVELKYMNIEVSDLLEIWGIEQPNPEYESKVKKAEEVILERNSPENIAKRNRQRENNNNGYRKAKIRR